TTTTTTTTTTILRAPSSRSGAGVHKQRLARLRGARRHAASRHDGHDDLDDPLGHPLGHPLDALGISSAPYRYEIRMGKVVPRAARVDIPLPSHQPDILAAPVREPPPRNPRRRTNQPQRPQQRLPSDAGWRPASSVYDQSDGHGGDSDSDDAVTSRPGPASRAMYRHAAEAQVSPPSSPETGHFRDGRMAGDVSPIDDEFDLTQQEMLRASRQAPQPAPYKEDHRSILPSRDARRSAPSARRGLPGLRGAGAPVAPQLRAPMPNDAPRERQPHPGQRPAAPAQQTRWNPGSAGEASRLAPDSAPGFDPTTTATGPLSGRRNAPSSSFGQRMSMMGRSRPEPVDSRPPWHGASGRSKIVQPVRDDTAAAPLDIPRRSSKRTALGEPGGPPSMTRPSGPETSTAGDASCGPLPPIPNQKASRKSASFSPFPSRPPKHPGAAPQAYPSPPDSVSLAQPPPPAAAQPTGRSPMASSPHRDALPTSSAKAVQRKPPPSADPTSGTPPRDPADFGLAHSHLDPAGATPRQSTPRDARAQLASRFSVTTFPKSNPGPPRRSADEFRPQAPTLPARQTSVMDRKRPFSAAGGGKPSEEPVVVSILGPSSAVDGEKNSVQRPTQHSSHSRVASEAKSVDRRSSMAKPLPPAPHELCSSQDRVAHLNAQIQGLVHRRININKSIQQMTELMPADNFLASSEVLLKREAEKQKVEALKEELAEVQRQEYDLGLKLHRTYKRLDKDSEFEPATLWVKRVTG
ncbi:Uncharacterized protein TCAP_07412, partial [Tolypocladium capitatum]